MQLYNIQLDQNYFSALSEGRCSFVVLKENAPFLVADKIKFIEVISKDRPGQEPDVRFTGRELLTEVTHTESSKYGDDRIKPGYAIVEVRPIPVAEDTDYTKEPFSNKEKQILINAMGVLLDVCDRMHNNHIKNLTFMDRENVEGIEGVLDQGDFKKYQKSMILNIARTLYEIQKSKIIDETAKADVETVNDVAKEESSESKEKEQSEADSKSSTEEVKA